MSVLPQFKLCCISSRFPFRQYFPNDLSLLVDAADPYLDTPTLVGAVPGKVSVAGVAVLAEDLFVVRDLSSYVDVYGAATFSPRRRFNIEGLRRPTDLTACTVNTVLYVSDGAGGSVYAVEPKGKIHQRWQMAGEPHGLYAAPMTGNVFVTCFDGRTLREYTSEGQLLRTIRFQLDITNPGHTIPLAPADGASGGGERFLVCHGWDSGKLHRVCHVTAAGKVVANFGGANGSGPGRLDTPQRLIVDALGYIFVLDRNNDRIQLLSPNLVHVRDIITRVQNGTKQPRRMWFDAVTGYMYVGLLDGRVMVFRIADP